MKCPRPQSGFSEVEAIYLPLLYFLARKTALLSRTQNPLSLRLHPDHQVWPVDVVLFFTNKTYCTSRQFHFQWEAVVGVGKFGSSCILYGSISMGKLFGPASLSKAESFSHLFWPAGGQKTSRFLPPYKILMSPYKILSLQILQTTPPRVYCKDL